MGLRDLFRMILARDTMYWKQRDTDPISDDLLLGIATAYDKTVAALQDAEEKLYIEKRSHNRAAAEIARLTDDFSAELEAKITFEGRSEFPCQDLRDQEASQERAITRMSREKQQLTSKLTAITEKYNAELENSAALRLQNEHLLRQLRDQRASYEREAAHKVEEKQP